MVARILGRPRPGLSTRIARSLPFVAFVGLLIYSAFQRSAADGSHALAVVALVGAIGFALIPISDAIMVASIAVRQSRVRSLDPGSLLLVGRWDQTIEAVLRGSGRKRVVNWFTVELGTAELSIWIGVFRPLQVLRVPWALVSEIGVDDDKWVLSVSGHALEFHVSRSAWAKGSGGRHDLDYASHVALELKAAANTGST